MSPDTATAERRFRFELAAHPGSPAQARRLTRARLTGWSVCEDTCDSAALVVSELVTNAIVHTASRRVVCELHDGEDLVRIAVRDEGCAPGEPQPSPQGPEEEHGRGLILVDALCHAWGAHEHGLGLLVWAELPRQADAPRDDTAPSNDLGWGARPKPGPSTHSGSATAQTHASGTGAGIHPGTGAEIRPGTGAGIHPGTGSGISAVTGTGLPPGTGAEMHPGAGAGMHPGTGAEIHLATGSGISPVTGTGLPPGTGAEIHPGAGAGMHPGTHAGTRFGARTEARPPHETAASTSLGVEPRRGTTPGVGVGVGAGTDTGGAAGARHRGTRPGWA